MYIEIFSGGDGINSDEKKPTKLAVRCKNQASTIIFNGLSDPSFISYIAENIPAIIVFCGDYRKYNSILTSEDGIFTEQSSQTSGCNLSIADQ